MAATRITAEAIEVAVLRNVTTASKACVIAVAIEVAILRGVGSVVFVRAYILE